eukprot:Hpha_TRINITY_DN15934_c1_g4::TRINITY_DN15934_c1_g4_i1::g.73614::m.73614
MRGTFLDLVKAVPPPVLPLSLGTLNLGVAWNAATSKKGLTGGDGFDVTSDALDVFAGICCALQFAFAFRVAVLLFTNPGQLFAEYRKTTPLWSAGDMALMGLAAWANKKGASQFAEGLWSTAVCMHVVHMGFFIAFIIQIALEGAREAEVPAEVAQGKQAEPVSPELPESPEADEDYKPTLGTRVEAAFRKLWAETNGGWFVPIVGIAAAASTGAGLIGPVTRSDLRRFALYAPLYTGVAWWVLTLWPFGIRIVTSGDMFRKPPSAVLMAPTALILAGWLSSASADYDLSAHWFTHCLYIVTLVFASVTLVGIPSLLYTSAIAGFNPAVASLTFPMDITAIACIKYQDLMKHSPLHPLYLSIAWTLLGLTTVPYTPCT